MSNFLTCILWILALYGLIEIIKNIYYIFSYTNLNSDGIYLIIAAKNQEKNIESFLRSVFFRIVYGKEEEIKNIFVTDLESEDSTLDILKRLKKEYTYMKILKWKDCKDLIDNIKDN